MGTIRVAYYKGTSYYKYKEDPPKNSIIGKTVSIKARDGI